MKVSELKTILSHLTDDTEIKTEVLVDLGEKQLTFKMPLITDFHLDINGNLILGLTNILKESL